MLWIVSALALGRLAAAAGDAPQPASTLGVLVIEVSGVSSPGTLHLEVYDAQHQERWGDAPLRRERLPVEPGTTAAWRVDGLASGEYAVRVFLDQNGNGALDRSPRGIPTEPFGFSNDARRRLGVPRIKAAAFHFVAPEQRIAIQLKGRQEPPVDARVAVDDVQVPEKP